MHDLKFIRENPQAFDAGLARRGLEPISKSLLALDEKRRSLMTTSQEAQARRNGASKEIGKAMGAGDKDAAEALKAEVASLKDVIAGVEAEELAIGAELDEILTTLPNIPYDDAPDGADEDDNEEMRSWGDKPHMDFTPKEHFDLGEALDMMDFERAAKMSGARFVTLRGQLARLERALGQFMIDLHTTEHGYTEMLAPAMVRDTALFGTGQLPKFEEDLFKTDTGHYLIPTAEVTLTNFHAGEILDTEAMPMRYTAFSQCFRSEAGSAGRDTRGMIRQHQFEKVEMVSLTTAEQSDEELERMTGCAEEVLKRLKLPYRVVKLCTGDMGFTTKRTYDIEVWLPGQDRFREISSCSVCGDFQARRAKIRHRPKNEKQTSFVHTLNGSGLAVGRTLVAVLENYQQADGSIAVPEVLKPYMGTIDRISK